MDTRIAAVRARQHRGALAPGVRWWLDARDALSAYDHFIRPRGAFLGRIIGPTVPLGGAGLRGFDPAVAVQSSIVALNAEQAIRLKSLTSGTQPLAVWGTLFADGGVMRGGWIADAGAGLMLRGWVYDRDVRLRIDVPAIRKAPLLIAGTPSPRRDRGIGDLQLTLGSFW